MDALSGGGIFGRIQKAIALLLSLLRPVSGSQVMQLDGSLLAEIAAFPNTLGQREVSPVKCR